MTRLIGNRPLRRRVFASSLLVTTLIIASPASVVHAADGDLDLSFSTDGKDMISISSGNGSDAAADAIVQSDGKILVTGGSVSSTEGTQFVLLRYKADGQLDPTFGTGGKIITNVSTGIDASNAITLQSDGKIVIAGFVGNGVDHRLAILRYNADGVLDPNFGSSGVVTTYLRSSALDDEVNDVAVQNDGTIVVVGHSYNSTLTIYQPAMVRYSATGTLLSSTIVETTNEAVFYGVALQNDGKIVAAGKTLVPGSQFFVARFTPSGVLDPTFSDDGMFSAATGIGSCAANSVKIQSDGKIVLGGEATISAQGLNFIVIRLNTNGSLDTSFSGDGIANAALAPSSRYDKINDIELQTDDKIMAVGAAEMDKSGTYKYATAFARFTTDGSLDTTFSGDGKLVESFSAANDRAYGVARQPNGKMVAVGQMMDSVNDELIAMRVDATSTLSTLSSLSLSSGSLAQTFASGTTSYTATVSPATSSIAVTPTVADQNATVKVNGNTVTSGSASAAISIPVGTTSIPVAVTSQDGTSVTTYTVAVTRKSDDATLSAVNVAGATVLPTFTSSTTSYSATVTNAIKSITLAPTVSFTGATVTVNGKNVSSGAASDAISLTPGVNNISVVTTAQDGTTTKTYNFTITRDVATVKVKKTITAKNVLASKDVSLASNSKVSIVVKSSSKKFCSVSGTKVKGIKKGSCTVTVSVTPKATKTVKKPRTTKTTVTVRVV